MTKKIRPNIVSVAVPSTPKLKKLKKDELIKLCNELKEITEQQGKDIISLDEAILNCSGIIKKELQEKTALAKSLQEEIKEKTKFKKLAADQGQATDMAEAANLDLEEKITEYIHKISKFDSDALIYEGKFNILLLSNQECSKNVEEVVAERESARRELSDCIQDSRLNFMQRLFNWF